MHHRTMLCVVMIDFLVHVHLDPKEIGKFQQNFSGFAWSLQAINVKILFLGQEFGPIFNC